MGRSEAALSRLGRADRAAVRDIETRLQRVSVAAIERAIAPHWLGRAFKELLRLDSFCGYRPERRSHGGWGLGERVSIGPDGLFERYDDVMARLSVPFHYDPMRPQAAQRNRVTLLNEICAHGPDVECVIEQVWPAVGLVGHDQLRVLLTHDGGPLLGWVGGMRREPFEARDRDVMTALVPAMRRSLTLHRKLVDADGVRAGLERALGILSAPAFIVRAGGAVEYANAIGAALLDGQKVEVQRRLREAVAGRDRACEVARLMSAAHPGLLLVILRETEAAFAHRLAEVARLWGTTRRQDDVLRWVVLGDSNKEIAHRLKCHESSVERHVTSLLRRARCDSRSRLVARFWTAR